MNLVRKLFVLISLIYFCFITMLSASMIVREYVDQGYLHSFTSISGNTTVVTTRGKVLVSNTNMSSWNSIRGSDNITYDAIVSDNYMSAIALLHFNLGVFVTKDDGQTWQHATQYILNGTSVVWNQIAFTPYAYGLVVASSLGLMELYQPTSNHWAATYYSYKGYDNVAVDPTGFYVVVTNSTNSYDYVFIYNRVYLTWQNISYGSFLHISGVAYGLKPFVATRGGSMYRFETNHWQQIVISTSFGIFTNMNWIQIVVSSDDKFIIGAAETGGVFISQDHGTSWQRKVGSYHTMSISMSSNGSHAFIVAATIAPTSFPSTSPSTQPSQQPTRQPTSQPTVQPTSQPSIQPSSKPTLQPSAQPSRQPTSQPSRQPSSVPSVQPSAQPVNRPTSQPSLQPTTQPSLQPIGHPSSQPTSQPTFVPSQQPSSHPSMQPTAQPSTHPSAQPSRQPSSQPSMQPSVQPSLQPTSQPSLQPTAQPSKVPSSQPTGQPSRQPSLQPVGRPTNQPTLQPSTHPSRQPTSQPSCEPTVQPVSLPSSQPSAQPSESPSSQPSGVPSSTPSSQPSRQPSSQPISHPSTAPSRQPSSHPSSCPSATPSDLPSAQPTNNPTSLPSCYPSTQPSQQPFGNPTSIPSRQPSSVPTKCPSSLPSMSPSSQPSRQPSSQPVGVPSESPTMQPSSQPTSQPNSRPTTKPTMQPSGVPTNQPVGIPSNIPSTMPSMTPSTQPTSYPSGCPSPQPSSVPTAQPSRHPSSAPSSQPNSKPSNQPTVVPSGLPSTFPTSQPSIMPTSQPSIAPSSQPLSFPTTVPTLQPQGMPTTAPSTFPTTRPSLYPTNEPTSIPSSQPSSLPSRCPSSTPSTMPSMIPTSRPSGQPNAFPTSSPSTQPTSMPTKLYKTNMNESFSNTFWQQKLFDGKETIYFSSTQTSSDCSRWVSFLSISTQSLLIQKKVKSIASAIWSDLGTNSTVARCFKSDKASRVAWQFYNQANAVIAKTSTGLSATNYINSTQCGSDVWQVATCVSNKTGSVVRDVRYCVNCVNPCLVDKCSRSFSPLIVSPCMLCETSSSLHKMLSISFVDADTPPSFIRPLEYVNVTSNALTLVAKLSKPGIVRCGLWLSSLKTSPISLDVISQQNINSQSAPSIDNLYNVSTIYLPNLLPLTSYDIYCYTSSYSGISMSLPESIKHKVNVTTACCKDALLSMSTHVATTGKSYYQSIKLSLSSLPTTNVTFTFELRNSTTTIAQSFIPRVLTWSKSSLSTSMIQYVSFQAPQISGEYLISLQASGPSKGEYNLPSPVTVVVIANSDEPPTPAMLSARYSSDGASVLLRFDSSTNMGEQSQVFPCRNVFTITCPTANVMCKWVDSSSVLFLVSGDNCVDISSNIFVRPNTVRAYSPIGVDAKNWRYLPSNVSVPVRGPLVSSVPTVVISSPTVIGECDDWMVSMLGSYGNAGRSWKSSTISVSVFRSGVSTASPTLTNFFNTEYSLTAPTAVPARNLSVGATYTITVTLCSFLGQCGLSSRSVTVLSQSTPTIAIAGTSQRQMGRSQRLSLKTQFSYQSCSGGSYLSSISYVWTVQENGAIAPLTDVVSISRDPSSFLLPAQSLKVETQYTVTVVATTSDGKSCSSSVQVYVSRGNLVAVISGSSERSMRISDKLVLDGSSSYDEDVAVNVKSNSLVFQWSCMQMSPVVSLLCPVTMESSSTSPWLVNVKADASLQGSSLAIALTVSDNSSLVSFKTLRSASTTVSLTLVQESAPMVSVSSPMSASSNGIVRMNPSQRLVLQGYVSFSSLVSSVNTTWSIDDAQLSSQLPLMTSFPVISTITTSQSINFVVNSNSLPAGGVFRFTLTGQTLLNVLSFASIVVEINSPPVPGVLSVNPSSGVELTTVFLWSTYQWQDSDLPLTYLFGYMNEHDDLLPLVPRSEQSLGSTVLVAGSSALNYEVRLQVVAYDSLLSNSALLESVTVLQNANQRRISNMTASLNASLSSGSVSNIKVMSSLTYAVLNSATLCDLAPNCSALHRQSCTTIVNTCGPCLAGYSSSGQQSSGNSTCISLTSDSSLFKLDLGQNCKSQYDCLPIYKCSNSVCSRSLKVCSGNCSSRGHCQYVKSTSGINLSECYEGDESCDAVCVCHSGYHGSACSYGESDYLQRRQSREVLSSGLAQLMTMEEPTSDSISGWVSMLSSLSQAPDEISPTLGTAAFAAVSTIASTMVNAQVSPQDSPGLLRTLDNTVKAATSIVRSTKNKRRMLTATDSSFHNDTYTVNEWLNQTMQSIHSYGQLQAAFLLYGEPAVSLTLDSFKQTVGVVSAVSMNSSIGVDSATSIATTMLPLTETEAMLGVRTSSVGVMQQVVNASSALFGSSMSVVVSSIGGSLLESDDFHSDAVSVMVDGMYCDPNTNCTFRVTLQNKLPVTLVQPTIPDFIDIECLKGDFSVHYIDCPDRKHNVTCRGVSELAQFRCPYQRLRQSCGSLGSSQQQWSFDSCRTVEATSDNITCECDVRTYSHFRRLQTASTPSTSSSSYASMGEFVAADFVHTWSSISSVEMTAKTVRVLATISTFVCVALACMVYTYHLDMEDESIAKYDKAIKRTVQETKSTLDAIANIRKSKFPKIKMLGKVGRQKPITSTELRIIDEALPSFLTTESSWQLLWKEMCRFHKWLGIVFFYSPVFPRPVRILSIFSNIVVVLFFQAVTYHIANPEDETVLCSGKTNRVDCLGPTMRFDQSQHLCVWSADGCSANENISSDITLIIFVSMFTAVFATPVNLLLDYFIGHVLTAKIIRHSSIKALADGTFDADTHQQLIITENDHRRLTVHMEDDEDKDNDVDVEIGLNNVTDSIRQEVEQEFETIHEKLKLYRRLLHRDKREQFDADWQLDRHGNFLNDSEYSSRDAYAVKKIKAKLLELRKMENAEVEVLSKPGMSRGQIGRHMIELFQTDLLTFIERKEKIEQSRRRQSISQLISNKQKSVKANLTKSDNATTILATKFKRNNKKSSSPSNVYEPAPVSLFYYVMAASTVTAINVTFLTYIFLFAIGESNHNQNNWFSSFMLWFFSDVFIVSSFQTFMTHYFFPIVVVKDTVVSLRKQLLFAILSFRNKILIHSQNAYKERPKVFNSAHHLMLSLRVAKHFSTMKEGQLLLYFYLTGPFNLFIEPEKTQTSAVSSTVTTTTQLNTETKLHNNNNNSTINGNSTSNSRAGSNIVLQSLSVAFSALLMRLRGNKTLRQRNDLSTMYTNRYYSVFISALSSIASASLSAFVNSPMMAQDLAIGQITEFFSYIFMFVLAKLGISHKADVQMAVYPVLTLVMFAILVYAVLKYNNIELDSSFSLEAHNESEIHSTADGSSIPAALARQFNKYESGAPPDKAGNEASSSESSDDDDESSSQDNNNKNDIKDKDKSNESSDDDGVTVRQVVPSYTNKATMYSDVSKSNIAAYLTNEDLLYHLSSSDDDDSRYGTLHHEQKQQHEFEDFNAYFTDTKHDIHTRLATFLDNDDLLYGLSSSDENDSPHVPMSKVHTQTSHSIRVFDMRLQQHEVEVDVFDKTMSDLIANDESSFVLDKSESIDEFIDSSISVQSQIQSLDSHDDSSDDNMVGMPIVEDSDDDDDNRNQWMQLTYANVTLFVQSLAANANNCNAAKPPFEEEESDWDSISVNSHDAKNTDRQSIWTKQTTDTKAITPPLTATTIITTAVTPPMASMATMATTVTPSIPSMTSRPRSTPTIEASREAPIASSHDHTLDVESAVSPTRHAANIKSNNFFIAESQTNESPHDNDYTRKPKANSSPVSHANDIDNNNNSDTKSTDFEYDFDEHLTYESHFIIDNFDNNIHNFGDFNDDFDEVPNNGGDVTPALGKQRFFHERQLPNKSEHTNTKMFALTIFDSEDSDE